MVRRSSASSSPGALVSKAYQRVQSAMIQTVAASGKRLLGQVRRGVRRVSAPSPGPGDWLPGMALGPTGARRFYLFRPAALVLAPGERLPLMVMLHGCGQTALEFAASTRMNRLAARERFLVLYLEQDRIANAHGCWNWFERRSGRADAEVVTIMAALDQVQLLYPVDRDQIAITGFSAGASMAALVATRHPLRFQAVAMHSGVAPGAAKSASAALGAMRGEHMPPVLTTAVGKAMGAAAQFGALPPLLVLHGDADQVVAAVNAANMASVWALATAAAPGEPRTTQRGKRRALRTTDYQRNGRTLVTLCEIAGLDHAWSGGLGSRAFSDADGPDATRIVWAFAQRAFREK